MNEKNNSRFYLIILSVLGFIGVGILTYFVILSTRVEDDRDNKKDQLVETQGEKRQVEVISDDQANKILTLCQGNSSAAKVLKAEGLCSSAQTVKEVIKAGPPGLPGIPGIPGKNGTDGKNGKDGQSPPCLSEPNRCRGANGTDGANGIDGQTPPCMNEPNQCRGENGTNGVDGTDGTDGASGPACPEGYTLMQYEDDRATPLDEEDDVIWVRCEKDAP